jgi:hypothetical protein
VPVTVTPLAFGILKPFGDTYSSDAWQYNNGTFSGLCWTMIHDGYFVFALVNHELYYQRRPAELVRGT